MADLTDDLCSQIQFNPVLSAVVQCSLMLVTAHFFNLVFKPLGQPGPVSQMLAGLILSPSFLSQIDWVRNFFIQDLSAVYYRTFAFISRMLFMFLIGLEMDIPYLKLHYRLATTVAAGGFAVSFVFAIILTVVFVSLLKATDNTSGFFITIIVLLANTASPVVIRLIDDLKFNTSELGRLAMTASLINEVSCILCYATYVTILSPSTFSDKAFFAICVTALCIVINKFLADGFAKWNKNSMYVSNAQILLLLVLVVTLGLIIEGFGYNATITGLLLGAFFPREGKTTRTLLKKLAYSIYNFILPIYFGYMAFQFDMRDLKHFKNIFIVILLLSSCIACKMIGTLAVCHNLKIPRIKGVLLAFTLNLKGNFELILIDVEDGRSATWKSSIIHRLLLIVIVLNTLISGPIIALILKKKESYFAHRNTSVESLDPNSEFRILSCAYEPRHATGQLVLTASLAPSSSLSPHLMHLVELPKKRRKTKLMYNQLEDGQYSDEEDYGGNDVMEINEAVDAFTAQTHMRINQLKIVNTFSNMYEDVCNGAEDFRVSIIFLPFHKHQRIDQIMEKSKEGYRTTNQKILRHAPCSVGVLVHKDQTGFQLPVVSVGGASYEKVVQHAALLFFGGADDREALALSRRIARHSNINLTVVRFLHAAVKEMKGEEGRESVSSSSSSAASSTIMCSPRVGGEPSRNEGLLMSLSLMRNHEIETAKDNVFFEEFRLRYVTSGEVGLIERYVRNGAETLQVLREILDSMEFSLFIVGKGSHGGSVMTTGLSDWEECPELGPVGDLLASSELDLKSSVLIIQQHRQYTNKNHEGSVEV